MSKRQLLSDMLSKTGMLRVLESFPSRPGIVIFNHHRVGDAGHTPFDRGVFSSTVDQFDAQIRYLKKRMPIVSGEELESLVSGKTKLDRMHAAITFDDGYLDNYANAFPVLKSHDATATFFLITTYVGTATVPWWDEIACLMRFTKERSLKLRIPVPATIKLDEDRETSIRTVLRRYKLPENHDYDGFLSELREQTKSILPKAERRFLSWDEAREMKAAGMEIGSHTCSHRLMSQLTPEEQAIELRESKAELERQLGTRVGSFAYPVGTRDAFTPVTEGLARAAGYSIAFSFHGGINRPGAIRPMHLYRTTPAPDHTAFRTQAVLVSSLR
jgi:peptidoglycan/xylan/chitin deacetylase (PgdA/CDA1 family)